MVVVEEDQTLVMDDIESGTIELEIQLNPGRILLGKSYWKDFDSKS